MLMIELVYLLQRWRGDRVESKHRGCERRVTAAVHRHAATCYYHGRWGSFFWYDFYHSVPLFHWSLLDIYSVEHYLNCIIELLFLYNRERERFNLFHCLALEHAILHHNQCIIHIYFYQSFCFNILGASVTFDCAATGNPKPEITWLNNGVAIDLK